MSPEKLLTKLREQPHASRMSIGYSSDDLRARKVRLAKAIKEKQLRDERKRQADLGEQGRPGGLIHFVRYFWSVLEPTEQLQEGWPLYAICMHLEAVSRGEIKRLLMNVCPGFMKSLLTDVFWPAWEWSAANMPGHRYVTFAYASSLTERDNGRMLKLIQSPLFQEAWGHVFKVTKSGAEKVGNDKTGWKLASSVRGVGTGERGSRVIVDDPHNVKEGESEVIRSETVRWFRESLSDRFNNLESGVLIVIMQRVHEGDVSGAILEHGMNYCHLMIPMEYDSSRHCTTSIGWEDPRSTDGELAWPSRFSPKVVAQLKIDKGPYAYAGQYQQFPTPRGGGIIKREYWQLWEEPAYPACSYRWASADTAYTEKEGNDPTGFTAWGLFNIRGQPNIILLDAWRKRLELHIPARWKEENSPAERADQVKRWQRAAWVQKKRLDQAGNACPEPLIDPNLEPWASYIADGHNDSSRWPSETYDIWRLRTEHKWGLCEWLTHSCRRFSVDELLIEGKASGLSVAQELRRLNGNEGWGIRTVTPDGDKTARLYSVQATFSAGLVWAPDRPWAEMVIDEITTFPKHKFKDLTDSTSMALRHIRDRGQLIRPEELVFETEMSARHVPQSKPLY